MFEADHARHDAAKEEGIRTELELTPARYYQLLSRLTRNPEAAAFDPILIHRLRRVARESAAPAPDGSLFTGSAR